MGVILLNHGECQHAIGSRLSGGKLNVRTYWGRGYLTWAADTISATHSFQAPSAWGKLHA